MAKRDEIKRIVNEMKNAGIIRVETAALDKLIDKLSGVIKTQTKTLKKVRIVDNKLVDGKNTFKQMLNQMNINELTPIGNGMKKPSASIIDVDISTFSRVTDENVPNGDEGAGKGAPPELTDEAREDMEKSGIPAQGLDAELERDLEMARKDEPQSGSGKATETTAPGTEDTGTAVEMTVSDEKEVHNEESVGDDVGEIQPPTEQSHKQANHSRIHVGEGEGIEQSQSTLRDMEEEALAGDAPGALEELQRIAEDVAEVAMAEEEEADIEEVPEQPREMPGPEVVPDEEEDRPQADFPPTESYQNLLVSSGLMSRPQYYEQQIRNAVQMIGHHTQKLSQLPADNYTKLSNKQMAEYIDSLIKIYGKKINVNRRLSNVNNRKDMEQEAHEINAIVHMYYMARLGVAGGIQTGVIIPAEYLGSLAPQLSQMTQQLQNANKPQRPQQQQSQPQGRPGFGQSQYAQQLGLPVAPSQFAQTSRPRQINTTQRNEFKGRLGLKDRVKQNAARTEARRGSKLEGLIFG